MLDRQRLVALVLALAAMLAPMAAGLLVPDPTWIGGLYDGGDGDEVATLVWDHSSALVPASVALVGLTAAFVVAAPAPEAVARQHHSPLASRAPPHA